MRYEDKEMRYEDEEMRYEDKETRSKAAALSVEDCALMSSTKEMKFKADTSTVRC